MVQVPNARRTDQVRHVEEDLGGCDDHFVGEPSKRLESEEDRYEGLENVYLVDCWTLWTTHPWLNEG